LFNGRAELKDARVVLRCKDKISNVAAIIDPGYGVAHIVFNEPCEDRGMPDFRQQPNDEDITKIQAFIQATVGARAPEEVTFVLGCGVGLHFAIANFFERPRRGCRINRPWCYFYELV
jgi:hypothetical protein